MSTSPSTKKKVSDSRDFLVYEDEMMEEEWPYVSQFVVLPLRYQW